MLEIEISVREKIAQVHGNPEIVCGNSDFTVLFDFDAEWNEAENLTANFQYLQNGERITESVPIIDGQCSVPVLRGTREVYVGVSGGTIRTAAPAVIPCVPCITDFLGEQKQPVRDIYNEIMEVIADA